MPNADAVDMRDRGLAPTAFQMSALLGESSLLHIAMAAQIAMATTLAARPTANRVPVSWHRRAKSLVLSPGRGDIFNAVGAQAHGPQAADAPAASSWLTKEENSYRAATGGSSMAWIQRRLDGTSCVGELCARRPARKLVRDRGLAPTAFKMSPLSGLNSHSSKQP